MNDEKKNRGCHDSLDELVGCKYEESNYNGIPIKIDRKKNVAWGLTDPNKTILVEVKN